MKRSFFAGALAGLCLTLAAGGALTSCSTDTTQHGISIDGLHGLYADQLEDSIKVLSFDTFTLTYDKSWLQVVTELDPITIKIPASSRAQVTFQITAEPNTTGSRRTTTLTATTTESESVTTQFVQLPYLNVTTSTYDSKLGAFIQTINAAGEGKELPTASLAFVVYDEQATLTHRAEWLTLSQTSGFTTGKSSAVTLTAEKNDTGAERTDTLTLTSHGVSTPIYITQKKVEK